MSDGCQDTGEKTGDCRFKGRTGLDGPGDEKGHDTQQTTAEGPALCMAISYRIVLYRIAKSINRELERKPPQ